MLFEGCHEFVHFVGDLERVRVIDKTGKLVGLGGVELDSDAVTLPEIWYGDNMVSKRYLERRSLRRDTGG